MNPRKVNPQTLVPFRAVLRDRDGSEHPIRLEVKIPERLLGGCYKHEAAPSDECAECCKRRQQRETRVREVANDVASQHRDRLQFLDVVSVERLGPVQ